MSGLKRDIPGLRFTSTAGASNPTPTLAVTPDEIDAYETHEISLSGAVSGFVGTTAVAGTSGTAAVVFNSVTPSWPRNVEFAVAGSAAGMAGTLTLNGRDQFGSVITEVIAFTPASNGGTGVGTRVFGQFTSGTVIFGTAVGGGTSRIGLGTTGTTTLVGLPYKLGGTTDIKILGWIVGTGAVIINGGTIAPFVDVPNAAIKAPFNIGIGTTVLNVWARPTFNSENIPLVANLPQRT